jgi:hypothetical protein
MIMKDLFLDSVERVPDKHVENPLARAALTIRISGALKPPSECLRIQLSDC